MLFQIIAPANNERGPRYAEKAFAALHQAKPRHTVTLVYGVREGQIGLFVWCHESDRDSVIEPIRAGYPDATVALVEDQRAADVSLPSRRGIAVSQATGFRPSPPDGRGARSIHAVAARHVLRNPTEKTQHPPATIHEVVPPLP